MGVVFELVDDPSIFQKNFFKNTTLSFFFFFFFNNFSRLLDMWEGFTPQNLFSDQPPNHLTIVEHSYYPLLHPPTHTYNSNVQ